MSTPLTHKERGEVRRFCGSPYVDKLWLVNRIERLLDQVEAQEAELAVLRTAAQEYFDVTLNPTLDWDGTPPGRDTNPLPWEWKHKPERDALAAALAGRPEDSQQ
jgi:hypothetical protein